MFKRIHTSSHTHDEHFQGCHRFEHWYVDNQVYFITARCRNRVRAFAAEDAKSIFWDRFTHYTTEAGFVTWIATLMDNHYHFMGYIREGLRLGKMMQRIHGSVSKLVNDTLDQRLLPFWRDSRYGSGRDYFDGCIRNATQCTRAYGYVLRQAKRHGITNDYHLYPHTRVYIPLEKALPRALELQAFLPTIAYPRYDRRRRNPERPPSA